MSLWSLPRSDREPVPLTNLRLWMLHRRVRLRCLHHIMCRFCGIRLLAHLLEVIQKNKVGYVYKIWIWSQVKGMTYSMLSKVSNKSHAL